jgi:hypothetical protein
MSGENNNELKAIRNMMDNVLLDSRFQSNNNRTSGTRKDSWGHSPIPCLPGPRRVSVNA